MHKRTWPDTGIVVFQSLNHVRLFVTPWTTACQAPLFFAISQSLPKCKSTEFMMLPNHLILCHCLLLLPSIFPRIRVFSNGTGKCLVNVSNYHHHTITSVCEISALNRASQSHHISSVQPPCKVDDVASLVQSEALRGAAGKRCGDGRGSQTPWAHGVSL